MVMGWLIAQTIATKTAWTLPRQGRKPFIAHCLLFTDFPWRGEKAQRDGAHDDDEKREPEKTMEAFLFLENIIAQTPKTVKSKM